MERHKTSLERIRGLEKLRASRTGRLGGRAGRVRVQFRRRGLSCSQEVRTGWKWLGRHIGSRFRDRLTSNRRDRRHDRLRAGSLVATKSP